MTTVQIKTVKDIPAGYRGAQRLEPYSEKAARVCIAILGVVGADRKIRNALRVLHWLSWIGCPID